MLSARPGRVWGVDVSTLPNPGARWPEVWRAYVTVTCAQATAGLCSEACLPRAATRRADWFRNF